MKKISTTTFLTFCICLNSFSQNTWVQKKKMNNRYYAVGFSIGNKGYIGTGTTSVLDSKNDFWEYDPLNNTWTQKANFAGAARFAAVGFSIGKKGYIGTGITYGSPGTIYNDFWEYNPLTNSWVQKASLPAGARYYATGFSIESKGYIGRGTNGTGINYFDFWQYNPSSNTWTQKAGFGSWTYGAWIAAGFSIGNKGYVAGYSNHQFWEYDPSTNNWTQKANYGGDSRRLAVGFSIGNKGYFGTGDSPGPSSNNDFWEYDPFYNTWTMVANYPGPAEWGGVGFCIGTKGYLGTGAYMSSGGYDLPRDEFYEYTPTKYCPFFRFNANKKEITTPGANDGSCNIKLANGLAPYSFLWSDGYVFGARNNIAPGTYTITSTDANGCYDVHVLVWEDPFPPRIVDNYNRVVMNVHPNPSSSRTLNLFIDQSKTFAEYTLKIIDVNGRAIKEVKIDENTEHISLDISSEPKGIYLLYLSNNEIIETKKIIIE